MVLPPGRFGRIFTPTLKEVIWKKLVGMCLKRMFLGKGRVTHHEAADETHEVFLDFARLLRKHVHERGAWPKIWEALNDFGLVRSRQELFSKNGRRWVDAAFMHQLREIEKENLRALIERLRELERIHGKGTMRVGALEKRLAEMQGETGFAGKRGNKYYVTPDKLNQVWDGVQKTRIKPRLSTHLWQVFSHVKQKAVAELFTNEPGTMRHAVNLFRKKK